jgi:hypothetical protein
VGSASEGEGALESTIKPLKTILIWRLVLAAVYMVGAVIDARGISGTCMFILMPYFAAIAGAYPVLTLNRFGAGVGVYVPYMSMVGHLLFLSREWFFTLPWMVLNGAFGGYTAYALRKRI